MRREDIDLHSVQREHLDIHERLVNWSRYVRPGKGGTGTAPMFRHYRSSEVWAAPTGIVVDTLDGHQIEKAVGQLPEKNRDAIRWHYVHFYIQPNKVCRALAVTRAGLAGLIHDGRSMLNNRQTR